MTFVVVWALPSALLRRRLVCFMGLLSRLPGLLGVSSCPVHSLSSIWVWCFMNLGQVTPCFSGCIRMRLGRGLGSWQISTSWVAPPHSPCSAGCLRLWLRRLLRMDVKCGVGTSWGGCLSQQKIWFPCKLLSCGGSVRFPGLRPFHLCLRSWLRSLGPCNGGGRSCVLLPSSRQCHQIVCTETFSRTMFAMPGAVELLAIGLISSPCVHRIWGSRILLMHLGGASLTLLSTAVGLPRVCSRFGRRLTFHQGHALVVVPSFAHTIDGSCGPHLWRSLTFSCHCPGAACVSFSAFA